MLLHSTAGFHSAGGNFRTPPLLFRRRPPQSNYPPDVVPPRVNRGRLEFQSYQGGISRLAPPELALRFQSLPPILHKQHRNPTPSYSKGAQGLSVLSRVGRICTASSISLSPQSRQYGSRYAFRAGRNLPDKEFRSCFPLLSQGHGLYHYPVCLLRYNFYI